MKPRIASPALTLILGGLTIAASSTLLGPKSLLGLPIIVAFLVAKFVRLPADLPYLRYRPRPTDAGRWVDAPIAELDKSTFGKLLASRMRREPGLHVVVRPAAPPACADALYDPELDGGR